mmetsp:Transcript_12485/g.25378  ORF Transcript_12485/g.25378 Transcript_12485/m.25378 type:complete len:1416 (-) Transcript_12485:3255-7502(-)|eukprot:CAMPEP_0184679058 /NCGR_PEP_ID=MMETSP0312-20130426/1886_1 /TAXON_ID=31354 /ORGANISM="Compsopogon coeruleus, Strain SAG 36.94" /LENGTH=1415 /DNA_ID=CAMNT_0027128259 /DNA_START=254 /DNA_END=4501 /DNA_ORIENTATION=+
MGVPKFYRWVSERYPSITRTIDGTIVPPIDNLYLDMNGVIHNCARPPLDSRRYPHGMAPSVPDTEIFLSVFRYLEQLVFLIKPRKLLMLAVDGVAPRAKLNQQRSRRFRSAKERQVERKDSSKIFIAGHIHSDPPFDSNCITPGTVFMAKLSEALKYFIHKKMMEDNAWASIEVILSGSETPGEGEHKIMEYIRSQKMSHKMSPSTCHCLYGLDADLIMLGLVTHEPFFFLLREKIDFQRWKKQGMSQRKEYALEGSLSSEFQLLSITLLREYLHMEFQPALGSLMNIERLVDDFVFLCFLVGNDFLPSLPTFDISLGYFETSLLLYKLLIPRLGGYLTDTGTVNWNFFETFLSNMGKLEWETWKKKKMDNRRGSNNVQIEPEKIWALENSSIVEPEQASRDDDPDNTNPVPVSGHSQFPDAEYREDGDGSVSNIDDGIDPLCQEAGGSTVNRMNEIKKRYYKQKMNLDFGERGSIEELKKNFVEGLIWTLRYYYEGCISWRWYYPWHYSPFASDLTGLDRISRDIAFEPGVPFSPFEQLLAVMPRSSAWCLPRSYQCLMLDESSPIASFYPDDFEVDMNGKKYEWESIVLLPFVDEDLLLRAVAELGTNELTSEEQARNQPTSSLVVTMRHGRGTTKEPSHSLVSYDFPQMPTVRSSAQETPLSLPAIPAGTRLQHIPFCVDTATPFRFVPTFRSLPVTCVLGMFDVNLYGMSSKKESLLVKIDEAKLTSHIGWSAGIEEAIQHFSKVGTRVFVHYPWKREALVMAIRNAENEMRFVDGNNLFPTTLTKTDMTETDSAKFSADVIAMADELVIEKGLQPGLARMTLEVRLSESQNLDGVATSFQSFVHHVPCTTVTFPPQGWTSTVPQDTVDAGDRVLFVGSGSLNGSVGHVRSVVKSSSDSGKEKLQVEFDIPAGASHQQWNGATVAQHDLGESWMNQTVISKRLGQRPGVVSRLLGTARFRDPLSGGDIDLGLGLKFKARSLCVPGYSRFYSDQDSFVFSYRTLDVLRKYVTRFPAISDTMESSLQSETRVVGEIIFDMGLRVGGKRETVLYLQRVQLWISELECTHLPLLPATSRVLAKDTVHDLERMVESLRSVQRQRADFRRASSSGKDSIKKGPFSTAGDMIYVERSHVLTGRGMGAASCTEICLGDRVAYCRATGVVPFGLKGFVIGIHENVDEGYEVVFDEGFFGGSNLSNRCSPSRGKAVASSALVKLIVSRFSVDKSSTAPVASQRQSHAAIVSGRARGSPNESHRISIEERRGDVVQKSATREIPSKPAAFERFNIVATEELYRMLNIRPVEHKVTTSNESRPSSDSPPRMRENRPSAGQSSRGPVPSKGREAATSQSLKHWNDRPWPSQDPIGKASIPPANPTIPATGSIPLTRSASEQEPVDVDEDLDADEIFRRLIKRSG